MGDAALSCRVAVAYCLLLRPRLVIISDGCALLVIFPLYYAKVRLLKMDEMTI